MALHELERRNYGGKSLVSIKYQKLHSFNPLMTNFPSHRNQSFDLQSKSTDWFLYDGNIDVKGLKKG